MSDMPLRSAAAGSFQVKLSVTYVVSVRVTVRVFPFFLTVTLLCFGILTVSIFGVRSYSDQRYASMQASVTQFCGGSIACTGGFGPSSTGSMGEAVASRMVVSAGGFGPSSSGAGGGNAMAGWMIVSGGGFGPASAKTG